MKFSRLLALIVMVVGLLAFSPGARAAQGTGELTLKEAVEKALENNPAVTGAESNGAAARAAAAQVLSEKGMQMRLDGRYTHLSEVSSVSIASPAGGTTIGLGEEDTWLAGLSVEKVIYSGGRLEAGYMGADSLARSREETVKRVRQEVAYYAERAFRFLLAAQQSKEAAFLTRAAAEEHLQQAQGHYQAETAARFDVLRAEVQLEEANEAVIEAENRIEVTRASLLRVLGMADGRPVAVGPLQRTGPLPEIEELLQQARLGRPEVAAMNLSLEASRYGIEGARKERWPLVTMMADYQYAKPESTIQYNRWSVNALLTLPILDGGRINGKIREAEAKYAGLLAERQSLLLRIEEEVRRAYSDVESSRARRRVAAKRVEQAEELLRLAGVRYEGGVATAVEVADAQASLSRARLDLVSARTEEGIAEAGLRLAVGSEEGF